MKIVGSMMRIDRRSKQCYCTHSTNKNTENFQFKTCFFNYEGSPPPALPPIGLENYNTTSYRCGGQQPKCCTVTQPCGVYDGVCSNDDQCEGKLQCGGRGSCAVGNNLRCCQKRSYKDLDASSHYFDLGPLTMSKEGEYKYMCTRNNDFSNRSHKGKLIVSARMSQGKPEK